MEVWTRLCALARTILTHFLCGEPCPCVMGEGESALQGKMGAASRHQPLAAGAGWWARVIWSESCCTMVLACGTVTCLSSLPWYPLLLLKAEGVSSPEFPPLLP